MPFKHRYFLLRHGESEANVEKIVSSNPEKACFQHGLTERGRTQAKVAAGVLFKVLEEDNADERDLLIYTSDFKRARETAGIAGSTLKSATQLTQVHHFHENEIVYKLDERLRERNFGDFEGTPNTNYDKVWQKDAQDGFHTEFNVESVNDVRNRTVSLVTDLENTIEKPALVVLSSHGDTLQILQTYFMNIPPTEHRKLVGITNAEVREMRLGAPGFELLFRELTEEEFEQLSEEEKEEYLAKKEAADKAKEEESVEPAENNNSDEFVELSTEEFEALSEDDKQKYLDRKENASTEVPNEA